MRDNSSIGPVESAMAKRDAEVLAAVSALRCAANDVADLVGTLLGQASPGTASATEPTSARVVQDAKTTRPVGLAPELQAIAVQMRFIESAIGRWLSRRGKRSHEGSTSSAARSDPNKVLTRTQDPRQEMPVVTLVADHGEAEARR